MYVLTPDRREVRTEAELIAEFEAHRDHGFGQFVLASDESGALSAVGEGFGPYTLEWFPAERFGTHFKAAGEFKCSEVLTALRDFFRGDERWERSYTWHEVLDERPPLLARILGGFWSNQGSTLRPRGQR